MFGLAFPSEIWGQTDLEEQIRQEERSADSQDGTIAEQPEPFDLSPALLSIEGAIRELAPEEDREERQRERERERRDLTAQEAMAWWAKLMFYASAATVFLTFLALIAIVRTLHHTRRAADSADGMLNEAKETTKAARDSVNVAREIGFLQASAYVSVKSATIEITNMDEKDLVASVDFANTGVTPASMFDYAVSVDFLIDGQTELKVDLDHHPSTENVTEIPPGVAYEKKLIGFNVGFNETLVEALKSSSGSKVTAKMDVRFSFLTLGKQQYRSVYLIGSARHRGDNDRFMLTVQSNIAKLRLVEEE